MLGEDDQYAARLGHVELGAEAEEHAPRRLHMSIPKDDQGSHGKFTRYVITTAETDPRKGCVSTEFCSVYAPLVRSRKKLLHEAHMLYDWPCGQPVV